MFILPAAYLGDGLVRHLLYARHRWQHKGYQRQADGKNSRGDGEHDGETVVQRQHERQRGADDPCERELRTHHRAEHHHFPRRVVGVLPGQGEELRHGGVRQRGQQHATGDKRQVVTIKGKQQRVAYGHGATKEDQLAAIALAVGSFRQPQADEDPGNGVDGVEQAYPKWLRPNLTTEKQAQRRRL